MAATSRHEASIPNKALEPLSPLVGQWKTVGTHPMVPGTTFHGHTSFTWLEGGAFLAMHSQIDEPEIPSGLAVFGSDDATDTFFMLYFDERGVSRKYDVTLRDGTWKCGEAHPVSRSALRAVSLMTAGPSSAKANYPEMGIPGREIFS